MVEALKKPSSEGRLRDEAASFRLPKGDVRGHEYHQFLKPSQTRRAMSFSAQTSPMMAYLAMMAPRLVELHRVLKPTGSLYLHCDPTARQFPKLILDGK
jgi:site-specific DNA-methyltransferase (adenine-specific)